MSSSHVVFLFLLASFCSSWSSSISDLFLLLVLLLLWRRRQAHRGGDIEAIRSALPLRHFTPPLSRVSPTAPIRAAQHVACWINVAEIPTWAWLRLGAGFVCLSQRAQSFDVCRVIDDTSTWTSEAGWREAHPLRSRAVRCGGCCLRCVCLRRRVMCVPRKFSWMCATDDGPGAQVL